MCAARSHQLAPPYVRTLPPPSSLCPATALQAGVLLLVHGEVTDPEVDFFDREKVFIQTKLKPLLDEVGAPRRLRA